MATIFDSDSSSSSSGDGSEWADDVAGNLDTFVRMSKAGLFAQANDFFSDMLSHYAADDFAVAAQYVQSLIDQCEFSKARLFMQMHSGFGHSLDAEIRTLYHLFMANIRIFTHFELDSAMTLAQTAKESLEPLLVEREMSPLKVRLLVCYSCSTLTIKSYKR